MLSQTEGRLWDPRGPSYLFSGSLSVRGHGSSCPLSKVDVDGWVGGLWIMDR